MTGNDQQFFEQRVLVLAPTAKDADLTRSIIGRAGVECVTCENLESIVEHLDAGAGAVLLVEEAIAPGEAIAWNAGSRRQPQWSDLPVLILARPGADSAGVAESMDLLGNVTVLERPTRVAALVERRPHGASGAAAAVSDPRLPGGAGAKHRGTIAVGRHRGLFRRRDHQQITGRHHPKLERRGGTHFRLFGRRSHRTVHHAVNPAGSAGRGSIDPGAVEGGGAH